VDGTRNVLETGIELGVLRMIYTSTVGVFGNTHRHIPDETHVPPLSDLNSEYERTKYEAHYEVAVPLQKEGAPITIVQPGIVTGANDPSPHITQIEMYLQRMPLGFGGNSGATWAHVDDIADGHILAAERGRSGESYILAGPTFTWRELMNSWAPLTGIPAPKRWAPPGVTRALMRGLRLTEALGLELPFSEESLETIIDVTYWARSDKAKRELGWQPRSRDAVSRDVLAFEMKRRHMPIPPSLTA
jgi:nucleoside-diphosphate-sugar epimerase